MWTENFKCTSWIYKKQRNKRSNCQHLLDCKKKKKWENSRKASTSASLIMQKSLCVSQQSGKFLKKEEYQTTLPASCEICMQIKKQQLEPDMEQRTGSKLRKEFVKTVYCHPPSLTSMKSTSWKIPGWMKHKLESRLPGEISITSDMQVTPP